MNRLLILIGWLGFFIAGLVWYYFSLHNPLFKTPYSSILLDEDNRLLGARIAADGQWRFPEITQIPQRYQSALIQFEDKRFFQHPGFDPISLVRAGYQNLKAGKIVSGGSTLSMQTIRLARNIASRNLGEKIYEIVLATRLELAYSKAEILQLYANHAPFGGNVVGIGVAGWRYWGYQPQQLSWSEAATLAVLPNQPALMHPGRQRNSLIKKRDRLLYRLFHHRIISEEEYQLSLIETIPEKPSLLPNLAPHLTDYNSQVENLNHVRQQITTLNLDLQQKVNERIKNYSHFLKGQEIHNAAIMIAEIESGTIKAYVANIPGTGENHAEYVDCIRAPRSTGSILKPILVASALHEGHISPNSLLSDIPVLFNGYRPENFHLQYDGLVSVQEALVRSLNIPMVLLLKDFGIEKFKFNLIKQGLTTINQPASHYGLSLILGGAEVNLWELCNTYGYWGRVLKHYYQHNGMYNVQDFRPLHYLIKDENQPAKLQDEPVNLEAGAIYLTTQMMKSLRRPDEEGQWQFFQSPHSISWKTGTSFGHRDAWAIGMSSEHIVGVWVGNANGQGRPGCTGIKVAAPLMFQIFDLLPRTNWEAPPWDELVKAPLCAESGYLPTPYCPVDSVWTTTKFERMPNCHFHRPLMIDTVLQLRINQSCLNNHPGEIQNWFVPSPLESYYYSRSKPGFQLLPPLAADCRLDPGEAMQFIYPTTATHWKIPRDQDGNGQGLVCKVAHRSPETLIYWHLDNQYLGTTRFTHELVIYPPPGDHLLTLVDSDGRRLEKLIKVI